MRRSAWSPAACARSSRRDRRSGARRHRLDAYYQRRGVPLPEAVPRWLGTNNVDHFHGRFPVSGPNGCPGSGRDSIAGLEKASRHRPAGRRIPTHRQPIVDLRIRRAIRKGARVYVVTPEPARLDCLAAGVIRYTAGQTGAVARALLGIVQGEKLTRGDYATRQAGAATTSSGRSEQLAGTAGVDIRRYGRWRARSQSAQ